jgi:hypothetical protein
VGPQGLGLAVELVVAELGGISRSRIHGDRIHNRGRGFVRELDRYCFLVEHMFVS